MSLLDANTILRVYDRIKLASEHATLGWKWTRRGKTKFSSCTFRVAVSIFLRFLLSGPDMGVAVAEKEATGVKTDRRNETWEHVS